jgi:hypothetical protein
MRGSVKDILKFFNINDLVHREFIQPGQSAAGWFYVQVLKRLCDAVQTNQCNKWQGQFMHHDNVLSHTPLVAQQFLTEENIPVIGQPPYSPNLVLSDFWLFPTLKMGLKGTRFATVEDIKSNAMARLRRIPKESSIGASNNGRINGAREREREWGGGCKGPTLKVIR